METAASDEMGSELKSDINKDFSDLPQKRKRFEGKYGEENVVNEFVRQRRRKRNSDESDESNDPTEDNPFECNICRRTFATSGFLQTHQRKHKNFAERKFTCALCSVVFDTNNELKKHKHVHKDEDRVFVCQKCKHAYTNYCDYELHLLKHTNRSLYRCTECKMYFSKNSYAVHIPTHYDRSVECEICHKRCNNLKTHMQLHMDTFQCPECDKIFQHKHYLESHLRVHTRVKPYQCLYCGRGFTHDSLCRQHTRLHTGEKPFQCNICKLSYAQKITLTRHLVTHETDKLHECEYCQKTFFHKQSLMLHIRGHTGENMYDCPHCDKKSASKTGLRTHIIYVHTTEKPFPCDICNMAFKTKQSLKRHFTTKVHKTGRFILEKKKQGPSK